VNSVPSDDPGADPGFQVRGVALKKIAPSGGMRENVWGISCEKITILRQKIIFFPILGGRSGAPPPWIRPWDQTKNYVASPLNTSNKRGK
jgi:hypothetical protein